MRRFLLVLSLCFARIGRADVDRDAARRAFDAFERNCTRDNGALWGVSLCGRIVIVDRATRDAVANDGWSGKLPENIGIANTSFDWNGTRASMVMWPLPANEDARDVLLLHERFHAIQDQLELPSSPPGTNGHLDTLDGRYLMRLEMRALQAALRGKAVRKPLADALAFRRARFEKFANAAAQETALDRNEGMAEYTGVRLFTTDRARIRAHAADSLAEGEKSDGFPRGYAYSTGPAWGLLLDEVNPGWRKEIVRGKTYEQMLARAAPRTSASRAAARYDRASLIAEEKKRDDERRARVASYVNRFVEGHVLVLPLINMNMQFDPNNVHPFEGHGTVYEHITVSDDWGKIATDHGALISSEFKTMTVFTSPANEQAATPPWTITLAAGWHTASGARPGDLVVQRLAQ